MRTKNAQLYEIIKAQVDAHYDRFGRSPTVREIEAGTGIPRSTVQRYLAAMQAEGEIEYDGVRSVRTRRMGKAGSETASVPLVGAIACGAPIYAEENVEEYFRLPMALVGRGNFFLLRAKGDSMIEAGVGDGDMVLVRQQSHAEPGQIVVALIDEDATLKRYYPEPENNRVRLHPENREMEDIFVDDCMVQGVAVKVLKDLE